MSQQVVTTQPGSTAVVTTQHVTVTFQEREWTTGLFGCLEDCKSCLCGWICFPCFQCQLATRLGEHCCVPFCVPGALTVMRTKVRTQHHVEGSVMKDCCAATYCGPCVACQISRELDNIEKGKVTA
ncbi:cornifelin-like [Ptychodera flava]|uniref:cornifelin-like n=1 Tax=Ptychodera flava TaxID=63121 RepID=UPI003969ED64